MVSYDLPFLLPHEVLTKLFARAINPDKLRCEDNMSTAAKNHLAFARHELQDQGLIGLGLWGDGCPNKFDRSQSLEVFCWNIPGATDEDVRNMRVPIRAIPTSTFAALKLAWMTCSQSLHGASDAWSKA